MSRRKSEVDVDAVIWAKTVPMRIAVLRQAKRMTQEQLAKAVGLTRTSIVNIESMRQSVTLETLYSIGKALGINPKKLLP